MRTQPIVILAEYDEAGAPTATTLQMLTCARSLSEAVVALIVAPSQRLEAVASLPVWGEYGVHTCLSVDCGERSVRSSQVLADACRAAAQQVASAAILVPSTYVGRETAARLAVAFNGPTLVDIAGINDDGTHFVVTRSALSGSWTTVVRTAATSVIAVRPSMCEETPAQQATAPERVPVDVAWSQVRDVEVVSSQPQNAGGRVSLTDARTVVVGGRGTEGDFSLVEELADVLGGAVGATRVATDEGWVDHSLQIGQTGAFVSPRLYIGLGVSGAVHHTVGMQTAERIVAVCDDPDAPIFEIADFGVVGDLFEVVPQALEVLRAEL